MKTHTAKDPVWDHEHMVTHVSQTILYITQLCVGVSFDVVGSINVLST